jgi:hypothetical protein
MKWGGGGWERRKKVNENFYRLKNAK